MKWFEKRGIVAKVMADNCIVLTPEGTYDRIPLPAPDTKVGAEVNYRNPRLSSPYRPWLMVASFLVFFMCYPLLNQAILPQAVAYISLDINHGVQMAVDKNMRVIAVKCFDDEAADLVDQMSLEGKGLNDAVTEVINQAIEQDYIKAGQNNLMISTVSPSGADPSPVDQEALCQVLEESIASRGYTGQVKMYAASDEFRQEAEHQKLSAGKYLLYEQVVKSGNQVSVADVNRQTVGHLADTYKLDLLPNYKKINVQTASANQEKRITVDDDGQNVAIEDYFKRHGSRRDAGEDHNYQRDTDVSRSYSERKSRITETVPIAGMSKNIQVPDENMAATSVEIGAVEIPPAAAGRSIKAGI